MHMVNGHRLVRQRHVRGRSAVRERKGQAGVCGGGAVAGEGGEGASTNGRG